MKFFLVLCAVVVIAVAVSSQDLPLTDEQKLRIALYAQECMLRHGVSKDAVQKLRNGDFTNVSDRTKCFAECFLEKNGFLKDGVVQEEVVIEKLGPLVGGEEKIREVIAACSDVQGTDNCDKALKLYQCYHEQHATVL